MFDYVKQLRLLTVLLLVLAVVPSSAGAMSLGAVSGALPKAQAVAEGHWGADACTGRVTILVMSAVTLAVTRGEGHDEGAIADSNAALCRVRVSWDRMDSRSRMCAVLVHEYGHLHELLFPNIDQYHSANPASVMHWDVPVVPAACLRAFTPYGVRSARGNGWRCQPFQAAGSWTCRKGGRWLDIAAI